MTLTLFPQPRRRRRHPGAVLHARVWRGTARITGPAVQRLLDDAGITRRQWDHRARAWAIPTAALDDLIAYAEHVERRAITVENVRS